MIGISARVSDLNAFLLIRESSQTTYPNLNRRATRTATLDGGSVVNDAGFSVGDDTYIASVENMSVEDKAVLKYIFKTYSKLTICTPEGCFLGVLDSIQMVKDPVQIEILITEQIS